MNKALPIVLILVIALAGGWYLMTSSSSSTTSVNTASSTISSNQTGPGPIDQNTAQSSSIKAEGAPAIDTTTSEEEEEQPDPEDVPAGDMYKTADEALEAIKKGSLVYDDTILQQFVKPGENCTWCEQVYSSLRDMIKDAQQSSEQKSYFGEILAVSGKVDNIKAIVTEIGRNQSISDKEALAESLELTIGGDDVVKYLSEFASTQDDLLKEAAIAAISNQGSRLAAEVLYTAAVDSKNADGYYSSGIGLGELVPDEESYSYLQEIVMKQDEYSHLAVKALINAGLPGLKLVVDSLTNSAPKEGDATLLSDAVDHVGYDDETKAYIEKLSAETKNPTLQKFAQDILNEFKIIEEEEKE